VHDSKVEDKIKNVLGNDKRNYRIFRIWPYIICS
jgi:hypothetical protein